MPRTGTASPTTVWRVTWPVPRPRLRLAEPCGVELDLLGQAMRTRPLVLAVWTFATGRQTLAEAVRYWQAQRSSVEKTQPQVTAALRG